MERVRDVIILGAGPAGLSAGLYAGRSRLDALIIEKGVDGGQIATTDEIENYPGQMTEGESGASLVARMAEQARRFGVERVLDEVTGAELLGPVKKVTCGGKTYASRAVIIATGTSQRPIGCAREKDFVGKGVSYCATCDGAFFDGLEVFVVGGGDSAVEEAIYLTKFARKVTVIHRRDELRAAKSIQEKAFANPKIAFLWDTVVEELHGDDVLSAMTVRNVRTGERSRIEADKADGMFGVFGFIGQDPRSGLFEGEVEMEGGYIVTDPDMHTSAEGVFAAGDIRKKSLRQVVTAAADGAIAATQAELYLSRMGQRD